jgi:hypothetical protein
MEAGVALNPQNLKLYKPDRFNFEQSQPTTPNEWFVQRYPEAYRNHGSPFLELVEQMDGITSQILPVSINYDFFGAVLGGRKDLGQHAIYYELEMAWYFKDSDGIYKTTTAEKLMNQYRALLIKCAESMPPNVHKLNLFHEWRSDRVCRSIIQRAKSILASSSDFFGVDSPHQRIKGVELQERLARKFVEELLAVESGKILMLQDAYTAFCSLLKQRELEPMKRADFKALVAPLIRDEFQVSLRNDLVMNGKSGVRGWKNVKLNQTLPA